MTDERAELKPCPFCGSSAVQGRGDEYVSCHSCGTCGPDGRDEKDAAYVWNRRAADAAPQAPCAKLVITDDHQISETSHQYAPGLPPGEHDVYCVPMSVAPPLADAARGSVSVPLDVARELLASLISLREAGVYVWPNHPMNPEEALRRALAAQEPSKQRSGT